MRVGLYASLFLVTLTGLGMLLLSHPVRGDEIATPSSSSAVSVAISNAPLGAPPGPFTEAEPGQSSVQRFHIAEQGGHHVLAVSPGSGAAVLYYRQVPALPTLSESYSFVYSGPDSVVEPFIANATAMAARHDGVEGFTTDLSVSRPGNHTAGNVVYRIFNSAGQVQDTVQGRLRTEPYFYRIGHTYRVDALVDGEYGFLTTRVYDTMLGPQTFDLTIKKLGRGRGLLPGLLAGRGPSTIEDFAFGPANQLPIGPHIARRASEYMSYLGYNAAINGAASGAEAFAFQQYFPALLIKHVRVSAEPRFLPSINAVAQYGINADVVTGHQTTLASLQSFVSKLALPPDALELWNEPNNAYQGTAYDAHYDVNLPPFAVEVAHAFPNVHIWGPSIITERGGYPPPSINALSHSVGPLIGAWNAHSYTLGTPENLGYGAFIGNACGASQMEDCGWYGAYNYNDNVAAIINPQLPGVTTEGAASYGSSPDICRHSNVDTATQQAYIERGMLYNFKLGHLRVYPYKFIDDGGCTDGFGTYGILSRLIGENGQTTFTPKPAYVSLVYLDNLLDDRGSGIDTFTPQPLVYSLLGATPDIEDVLLAESDGSYRLVLWSDKPLWDFNANGFRASGSALPVVSEVISLRLANSMAMTVYTQTPGTGAWKSANAARGSSVRLTINQFPLVVSLTSGSIVNRISMPQRVPTPGPAETARPLRQLQEPGH